MNFKASQTNDARGLLCLPIVLPMLMLTVRSSCTSLPLPRWSQLHCHFQCQSQYHLHCHCQDDPTDIAIDIATVMVIGIVMAISRKPQVGPFPCQLALSHQLMVAWLDFVNGRDNAMGFTSKQEFTTRTYFPLSHSPLPVPR